MPYNQNPDTQDIQECNVSECPHNQLGLCFNDKRSELGPNYQVPVEQMEFYG